MVIRCVDCGSTQIAETGTFVFDSRTGECIKACEVDERSCYECGGEIEVLDGEPLDLICKMCNNEFVDVEAEKICPQCASIGDTLRKQAMEN